MHFSFISLVRLRVRVFLQDRAAEAAPHLFLGSHVPASHLGPTQPQPLGVLLLLHREQVATTSALDRSQGDGF